MGYATAFNVYLSTNTINYQDIRYNYEIYLI